MKKNENSRSAAQEQSEGHQLYSFEDALLIEGEPVWKSMKKVATFCAELVEKHFGEHLDFSPQSMKVLDRVIHSGWSTDNDDGAAQVPIKVQVTFGAYIGEVLVRQTSGRWVSGFTDEEPATILFIDRKDEMIANVSPFLFVREKFAHLHRFDLSIAWAALEQSLTEAGAL